MNVAKGPLIIISGGGTGGPSTAPLALAKAYQRLDVEARFLFVGNDPVLEQRLFSETLLSLGANYYALPAGRWRRYFSWQNFVDLFKIIFSFFLALFLFLRLRPALIISAGSFASVPVVWAGRLLGVKILVHQQDIRPGLANRLMAPFAHKISVTFSKSLTDYGERAVLIGNPSEAVIVSNEAKKKISQQYNLVTERPFLLVTGGGSGALALNKLFFETLVLLPIDWQIIHQTGHGKSQGAPERSAYQVFEVLPHEDFEILLSLSDMVFSRAGLGALTEMALLAKPAVLLPIPTSQQEDNAAYFQERGAAISLNQAELNPTKLAAVLQALWQDQEYRYNLSDNIKILMPTDAAEKGARLMQNLLMDK